MPFSERLDYKYLTSRPVKVGASNDACHVIHRVPGMRSLHGGGGGASGGGGGGGGDSRKGAMGERPTWQPPSWGRGSNPPRGGAGAATTDKGEGSCRSGTAAPERRWYTAPVS